MFEFVAPRLSSENPGKWNVINEEAGFKVIRMSHWNSIPMAKIMTLDKHKGNYRITTQANDAYQSDHCPKQQIASTLTEAIDLFASWVRAQKTLTKANFAKTLDDWQPK